MASKSKQMANKSLSWSDLVKKVVYTGIGGAAMAKNIVTDSSLPRKMTVELLSKAERGKDEVLNILAREVSKFLEKVDVSKEISKALKGMIITLTASIDFKDKTGRGAKPDIKITKAKVEKRKSGVKS